ncbi:hypothetical protein, partial [Streptomyces sparsus]
AEPARVGNTSAAREPVRTPGHAGQADRDAGHVAGAGHAGEAARSGRRARASVLGLVKVHVVTSRRSTRAALGRIRRTLTGLRRSRARR